MMDASIQTVLDLAACLGPQRDGSSEGLLPAPGAKRQFVRRRRPAQGLALLPADAPLNRPGRCGAATGRKAGPRGRSLPSAFSRRSVPARGGGRRASAEGGGRAPRPWVSGSRSGHSDWREVRGALWDGGRCSQGWGGGSESPAHGALDRPAQLPLCQWDAGFRENSAFTGAGRRKCSEGSRLGRLPDGRRGGVAPRRTGGGREDASWMPERGVSTVYKPGWQRRRGALWLVTRPSTAAPQACGDTCHWAQCRNSCSACGEGPGDGAETGLQDERRPQMRLLSAPSLRTRVRHSRAPEQAFQGAHEFRRYLEPTCANTQVGSVVPPAHLVRLPFLLLCSKRRFPAGSETGSNFLGLLIHFSIL